MKNVLIISSSPRINGNSDLLAKEFFKGAERANNRVELINISQKKINYCLGCYACRKLGHCFQNDDMNEMARKVSECDVLVLASPVYFYTMCGQLKVFIDRLVQSYTEIHADIYILLTAADDNLDNLHLALESIRGCTRDCLEGCEEKGVIVVGNVENKGDIELNSAMKTAFDMGKNC